MEKDIDAKSWGEMLNSYRTTYGASAYSTVKGAVDVPPRFPRTSLTPFGDQHHKNVHSIGADYAQERYATEQKRHAYHGRGPSAPWLKQPERPVLAKQRDPNEKPGRMFATLAHASDSDTRADCWIGNKLVDPKAGRHHVVPPQDPKGRKDLFDVLNQRNPGKPSDDSWLGHSKVDPAKGRRHNEDPAQRQGRRDLFPVIQQEALDSPALGGPAPRHKDPLGDLWIGHMSVDPRKGKSRIDGVAATQTIVDKQAFQWDAKPDNDRIKEEIGPVGKRAVPGGRAYGVPALVHRDPAYPEDPMVTTRRLVQPPIRDGTGVKERPSRRPIGDKTKEIRFESHYDLRWHGEEKGAFTDKEMKKMHRGIKGTIPGLRPRGSAGLQTRVRGPRGTA